ncbi:MAG TPA: OmpA family protein [Saprospiraceae bacterium]|nr:OmpA family protein [Saprospiraceae bacterium]HMP25119.1 OmpA family protein [Saprospiraceae bacterium]
MTAKMLSFLIVILCVNTALAQVSKGFRFIDNEQWDKATEALEKDLNDPVYGASAHWGLHKVALSEGRKLKSWLRAYHHITQAEVLAKNLSRQKHRELSEKKWLTRNFDNAKSRIRENIEKDLLKRTTLPLIDEVLDLLSAETLELPDSSQIIFDAVRRDAVQQTLQKTRVSNYTTLYSLFTRHHTIIEQNNFLFPANSEWLLICGFINEFSAKYLQRFVEENPKHYINKDCCIAQCLAVIDKDSLAPLLDFLNDCPLSSLYETVVWRIKDKDINNHISVIEQLTVPQRTQWDNINMDKKLSPFIFNGLRLDSSFHQQMLTYMERSAPNARAHYLMETTLQRYIKSRQWDFAEELARKSQPYFSNIKRNGLGCSNFGFDLSWFDAAIPILQRPAENIKQQPLSAINTRNGNEFSPVPTPDGKTLYFAGSGRVDNIKGEDVFVSHLKDGRWTKPVLVKNLSGPENYVPLSLSSDARQMLVFVNNKLRLSEITDTGWGVPQPIPGLNEKAFPWIGRAVFGDYGRVIIFSASTRQPKIDKASDTDIFVMFKTGDTWGKPFSIGRTVNTSKQERSPYLSADGITLYFSSNGHKGLGGMDVYKTTRLDSTWTKWSTPENAGKEINNLQDDWCYFSVNTGGRTAFIAHTHEYGGIQNIYTIGMPEIIRSKPYKPITATIELKDSIPVRVAIVDANGQTIGEATTKPDGTIDFAVPLDIIGSIKIVPVDPSIIVLNNELELPASEDEAIVLPEPIKLMDKASPQSSMVFFDKNASTISKEARTQLEQFYKQLSSKALDLEIIGFADPDGDVLRNKQLSKERADAVKKILVDLGYPAIKISTSGHGTEVTDTSIPEEKKAQYRRVEIKFLKSPSIMSIEDMQKK